MTTEAVTRSYIAAASGCVRLELEHGDSLFSARLTAIGQVADRGVPAWEHGVVAPVLAGHRADA
jgi:hypothetical protein